MHCEVGLNFLDMLSGQFKPLFAGLQLDTSKLSTVRLPNVVTCETHHQLIFLETCKILR